MFCLLNIYLSRCYPRFGFAEGQLYWTEKLNITLIFGFLKILLSFVCLVWLFTFNYSNQICNLEDYFEVFTSSSSWGNNKLEMPLFPSAPLRYRKVFLWTTEHISKIYRLVRSPDNKHPVNQTYCSTRVFSKDISVHWKWFPHLTCFSAWPFICRASKISRIFGVWEQKNAWGTRLCRKLQ